MSYIQYSATASTCGGGGGSTCCNPPSSTSGQVPNNPLELHICMGMNACKGHDRFGTNNCAGTGFCATVVTHTCHTLNNCKGQGGCGLYGTADEQEHPGDQNCAWQGSCSVPIQAERYSTLGYNQGKSVWKLARKLFENRMIKANRTVGPSPFECGPPQAWLETMNPNYSSCGSSGNKVCSFGLNKPEDNTRILCEGGSETAN